MRAAPADAAYGGSGWTRFLLFDAPVFLAASVSVAVFYICAQRELYPRTWMKEMLLLPALIALGIGLSLNNAKAVLEAIFNRNSPFVRTPKYGIGDHASTRASQQAWRASRYLPMRSLLPLVELGFAVYFTWFVYNAAVAGQFTSLPFLIFFQLGFCYVAFTSLKQWLPTRSPAGRPGDGRRLRVRGSGGRKTPNGGNGESGVHFSGPGSTFVTELFPGSDVIRTFHFPGGSDRPTPLIHRLFDSMESAAARTFVRPLRLLSAAALASSAAGWLRRQSAPRRHPQPDHHQRARPEIDAGPGRPHAGELPDLHVEVRPRRPQPFLHHTHGRTRRRRQDRRGQAGRHGVPRTREHGRDRQDGRPRPRCHRHAHPCA